MLIEIGVISVLIEIGNIFVLIDWSHISVDKYPNRINIDRTWRHIRVDKTWSRIRGNKYLSHISGNRNESRISRNRVWIFDVSTDITIRISLTLITNLRFNIKRSMLMCIRSEYTSIGKWNSDWLPMIVTFPLTSRMRIIGYIWSFRWVSGNISTIYQSWIIRVYVSVYSVKISVKVRHINLFLTRRFLEILLRRDDEI